MDQGPPTDPGAGRGDGPEAVLLDLRGTPCPQNYVRCRLALEKIPAGACLRVRLDPGEPEQMVSEGLRGEGHEVHALGSDALAPREGVQLIIRRGGR